MSDIEKIINDAWENKDQVNQNSDKNLKDIINQTIDDLFEGKIMDIVDFNFKPKPNPESLKLMCENFQISTNEETVYIEDICKNLTSDTAKNMIKVWFSNDEPINNIDKYKDVVDYRIDNLALFLKKIRLLKEK